MRPTLNDLLRQWRVRNLLLAAQAVLAGATWSSTPTIDEVITRAREMAGASPAVDAVDPAVERPTGAGDSGNPTTRA